MVEKITDEAEAFRFIAETGKKLMDLHVHYEQAPLYPLEYRWSPEVPRSYYVTRMHLTKDLRSIVVNTSLTLVGIPPVAHEYMLGNRSALEWVCDQYRITKDERSGIISNPNREDDEEYIVHLVCQVVYVSVETQRLTAEMAARVNFDDFDLLGILNENEANPQDYWKQ